MPPAEAGSDKSRRLIGTTEVVPCYKTLARRPFQQPVKGRRRNSGSSARLKEVPKKRTADPSVGLKSSVGMTDGKEGALHAGLKARSYLFPQPVQRALFKSWTWSESSPPFSPSFYFFSCGGYFWNSLVMALFRLLMFLLLLSEMVSVAEPRHNKFLFLASASSTTSVPSLVT